jgi:hypothetical protein
MRTIQVYSEGDKEMLQTLRASFSLIANAVYNAYIGQRHAESLAPEILFLQGIPFDPSELQQSFRYVGVKPPEVSPASARKIMFLDEGFEPYKLLLDRKTTVQSAQIGREEHWAKVIKETLASTGGLSLIRAGIEHIDQPSNPINRLTKRILRGETGKLPKLLGRDGICVEITHRIGDVNEAFGRN